MSKFHRWLTLFVVSSALFVIVVDATVLYTVLPRLTHDLQASVSEKLWIINAYTLVMSGLLLGSGTLGDKFGHKKLFSIGLVVFGIASGFAAFSPTANALIISRVLLAVGASLMMPATLSIVRLVFSDEEERVVAIGVWASIAAGGAGLGPLVGGLLIEYFWWGSVFLINVPIVIIAFILTQIYIPSFAVDKSKKWDFVSSIQAMIGLIAIVHAIKEFSLREGSFFVACIATLVGIVFLYFFVRRQLDSDSPILDFKLFKNVSFASGVAGAILFQFSLVGFEFILTQKLQLISGYTPFRAGLYLSTMAFASFFSAIFAGKLINNFGVLKILWLSFLASAIGISGYLLFEDYSNNMQIMGLILFGFGVGSGMTAASNAIMNNSTKQQAGMAASIEEVSYEFGSAISVAIVGSFIALIYTASFILPEGFTVASKALNSLDEAILVAEALSLEEGKLLLEIAHKAFNRSFMIVVWAISIILFISTIILRRVSKH